MSPGIIVPPWAVVVALVVFLGIGACIAYRLWRDRERWLLLPVIQVFYRSVDGKDRAAGLVHAWGLAIEAIVQKTPWSHAAVEHALLGTKVLIEASDKWFCSELGFSVAEQTYVEQKIVTVGPMMRGLAHGLGHILRWELDRTVDTHEPGKTSPEWVGVGLADAESLYLTSLELGP